MKTIQTILEEFDREFKSRPLKMRDGKIVVFPRDYSPTRIFIRTAFDEYKKGLREAVEGMKRENTYSMAESCRNDELDSVLELLK